MTARHGTALGLVCLVLALWSVAMAWTLDRSDPAGGVRLAVFPLGTSKDQVLAAVVAADGAVVAPTWVPLAWLVAAPDDRLRAAGAVWTAPAAPFQIVRVGGCGLVPWRRGPVGDAAGGN